LALFSLVLASLLGGYFLWNANDNSQLDYFAFPWRTNWIKAPFTGSTACFRKEILLTDGARSAYIALAADNFYELKINGLRLHKPFFLASKFATWDQEQSIYTELGYSRHDAYARIYDIKSYLRPGRNVITVKVQSDVGTPRLLVQGEIQTASATPILSDTSWTCYPHEDKIGNANWDNAYFTDASWPKAQDTGLAGNIPADGPVAPLIAPVNGFYITPSNPAMGPIVFKKTIHVPSDDQIAWLRVGTPNDFDIAINGRLVYGTSMLMRYRTGMAAQRGDTDAISRVEAVEDERGTYPTAKFKTFVRSVLMRNVFHEGDNEISVTLHQSPILELRNKESLWMDGNVISDNDSIPIATNSDWVSRVGISGQFTPSLIDSTISYASQVDSVDGFGLKVKDGIPGFYRFAEYSVLSFLALLLLGIISAFIPRPKDSPRASFLARIPSALPAMALSAGLLIQLILTPSNEDPFYASSAFAARVMWITLFIAILATLIPLFSWLPHAFERKSPSRVPSYTIKLIFSYVVLVGLLVASAMYCFHGLASQGLLADEYVSMVAARGIVHHGVPVFENTGIIYTRSALYHYLLAFFMLFGGAGNKDVLVFLSVIWHLATVVLAFVWLRQMKGLKAALLAAALIALCPLLLYFAREIRFYSQLTFFATLCFYYLWRSLQVPEKQWYKVATLLSFAAAYLSQEFAVGLLPALFVIIFLSGDLRRWFRGWSLVAGIFAIGVIGLDALAYYRYCQTALPYVDSESVSPIAFHADVLDVLPSMLLDGYERSLLVCGVAYLAGALWAFFSWTGSVVTRAQAFRKGWTWWSFLYISSFVSLTVVDMIVSRPTPRYVVFLGPMVLITVACCIDEFINALPKLIEATSGRFAAFATRGFVGVSCIVLLVVGYRPARTWEAGEQNAIRDLTSCTEFLKGQVKPSDKLVFFSPEAALYDLGRCDYVIKPKKGSIFKYMGSDGVMRERNSGAIVIDNTDKLREVLANSDRVWIVLQTQNLTEPGADTNGMLTKFVKDNFKVAYEPVSMMVLEWDRSDGHLRDTAQNTGYASVGF
jgi:4-amino-4-deoxy-L-arabinose transferase-like glycosyltransferase